jgi:hypothetical protein
MENILKGNIFLYLECAGVMAPTNKIPQEKARAVCEDSLGIL